MMKLHNEIVRTINGASEHGGSIVLSVDVREVKDDGETYFVAECLEIPGCVSEGATPDEARANIEDAMRLCVSVVIEDCFAKIMQRPKPRNRDEVSNHLLFNVNTTPQLECA